MTKIPPNKVCTYLHRRASDGAIFYVGMGIKRRPWAKDHRNQWWRNVEAAHGRTVEVLAIWDTHEEAAAHERLLIECLRSMGAVLCNITEGGEGALGRKHTEDAKRRISEAKSGKPLSEEHKARISAYMRGRPKSEAQRQRMSASRVGRKKPAEEVAGYLPALRAAMQRPDVRAKISAAATGRRASEETKKKMSAAKTGLRQSSETKAKKSAALIAHHERKRLLRRLLFVCTLATQQRRSS